MAKFYGEVGYGHSVETSPGVWEDVITVRKYFGDVSRNTRQLKEGENNNPELSTSNLVSIVADAYANEHFFAMRYIKWAGALWSISNIDVQSPRLILTLGGVYHGPTAETTESA